MLISIEDLLLQGNPDIILDYGDTKSNLLEAPVAIKLLILTTHVEAGLRSYKQQRPEEHNRVLADHCSGKHFCPTLRVCKSRKTHPNFKLVVVRQSFEL